MTSDDAKHVLGLSGGRDSAALAVYMRQHRPELEIEYFFTDTGKELPEVYEFLGRLEGFLGQRIEMLNPDRDFDFWLEQYNDFLPSPQTRWCTRQLKLRPSVASADAGRRDQGLQLRRDSRRRAIPGRLRFETRQSDRQAAVQGSGNRQGGRP